MIISIALVFCSGWFLYTACRIARNCNIARPLGLPIIISAVSLNDPLWHFISLFIPQKYQHTLSIFFRLNIYEKYSWNFADKYTLHDKYGAILVLVTPHHVELIVADWQAATQILARSKDFGKPTQILKKLDNFGQSLASVEGAQWRRHRKFTAGSFDRAMDMDVWRESFTQAGQVLSSWSRAGSIDTTHSNIVEISLDILFKSCIGIVPRHDDSNTNKAAQVCRDMLTAFLQRASMPEKPWFLRYLTSSPDKERAKLAVRIFGHAVGSLLEDHAGGGPTQNGLLSSMARGFRNMQTQETALYLSKEEVQGNLFLFMFAGHETTANTLVYIIHLLAIFPEWQDWIGDEID
ncbi:hypothetical protein FE257_006666 [Aspergillus nanangensis]|uniref:Cytochrome P450 n=1 Tax=Aspergillus nanangensis TaxID=2582783 RepID=A0AAD4CNY7_ASPNN|nr:hypothetical protein FE257_006666 [Aspergillus nanangensis]